jgi:hypothetical protein
VSVRTGASRLACGKHWLRVARCSAQRAVSEWHFGRVGFPPARPLSEESGKWHRPAAANAGAAAHQPQVAKLSPVPVPAGVR